VTFDDQLIGFGTSHNGQFTFTFNVPLSQTGSHTVKALDGSGAKALTSFVVTASPAQSKIEIKVTSGTIYFPGDTAVIFVQANINGQPTSTPSLQIILVRPSGSNVTLNPTLVGIGEWKAVFAVPTTGSIGTYAIVVKARQTGSADGLALSGFQVKPTWIQSHSSTIIGAIAALGTIGAVGISWRSGYVPLKRGKTETLNRSDQIERRTEATDSGT